MNKDCILHYGEPQAGVAVPAVGAVLEEAVKDTIPVRLRDAGTLVLHEDDGGPGQRIPNIVAV